MSRQDNEALLREDQEAGTNTNMSRRRLLKAVAAGGAATALAFVPHRWSKPVVEAGELAAHAEASPTSPTPRISELILLCGPAETEVDTAAEPVYCWGSICYDDPLGQVDEGSLVIKGHFELGPCEDENGAGSSSECPEIGLDMEFYLGDFEGGSTKYRGCFKFETHNNSVQDLLVPIEDCCVRRCMWIEVNGRKSNVLCDTVQVGPP